VLLESLNSDEADELIDRLLPDRALDDTSLRARALEAAAGNPLFLQEIAAVVASSGGEVVIPPTIQALLAARLDQLDPAERRVLERGSVEGNSFHRGAVEALGPEEALLDPRPTWADFWRARIFSLTGHFDEARAAYLSDVEQMSERGDRLGLALGNGWEIEMQAGEFARAQEAARHSCRQLEEMEERSFWSTKACEVAQSLYCLGRYEEAETWARFCP
jgi:tetratricopeptide (TPR) repeat protein